MSPGMRSDIMSPGMRSVIKTLGMRSDKYAVQCANKGHTYVLVQYTVASALAATGSEVMQKFICVYLCGSTVECRFFYIYSTVIFSFLLRFVVEQKQKKKEKKPRVIHALGNYYY